MYSFAHKLTHLPNSMGLVVEEILTELEKSSVVRGNKGYLSGGGGERVGEGLFQDDLLEG